MTPELLPCPFCGTTPKIMTSDAMAYRVTCDGCDHGQLQYWASRAGSIAAWNKRTLTDEMVERGARVYEPKLWAKIDKWIADDDWNGGTARNARKQSIDRMRLAFVAITDTEK